LQSAGQSSSGGPEYASAQLLQHALTVSGNPTERVGEEIDSLIDIESLREDVTETDSGVKGDIAQSMQFINDHRLDDLINVHRPARALVILRMIGLLDQVAAKKHVESSRLPGVLQPRPSRSG
jgi:hypothetical protein